MRVQIDRQSWEQGVKDGAANKPAPAWSRGSSHGAGRDSFSYSSGRVEGEAYRRGYEVTKQVADVARAANPKPVDQITDRAKRYRANRNSPPGPRRCNFCGSRKNVDVDHISGDESDGEPENLMFLCRSCNAQKAVTQARNKIGVRTAQFNPQPEPNFREFQHSAAVLLGLRRGNAGHATALIRATPPKKRAEYAERIARNPAPDFRQYIRAVVIHQRGAHDEGGKIIHSTPPQLRSQYAREIADIKAGRRGEVPF
jgi:hypothetical protein